MSDFEELSPEEDALFQKEYAEAQEAWEAFSKKNNLRTIEAPRCETCKHSAGDLHTEDFFEGEGVCHMVPKINKWLALFNSVTANEICDEWKPRT